MPAVGSQYDFCCMAAAAMHIFPQYMLYHIFQQNGIVKMPFKETILDSLRVQSGALLPDCGTRFYITMHIYSSLG